MHDTGALIAEAVIGFNLVGLLAVLALAATMGRKAGIAAFGAMFLALAVAGYVLGLPAPHDGMNAWIMHRVVVTATLLGAWLVLGGAALVGGLFLHGRKKVAPAV